MEHRRRDFIRPMMARKLTDALGVDPEELFS
jgi:hypothetical protein